MNPVLEGNRNQFLIDQWSAGYFSVNSHGEVTVCPSEMGCCEELAVSVPLRTIVSEAEKLGARLPLMLCFDDILRAQMQRLQAAFDAAIERSGYQGRYMPAYPIKVNQDRSVLEAFAAGQTTHALECGSKAELMAIMACAKQDSLVICNGVKDADYIALALHCSSLGLNAIIVIEKQSELELVIRIAGDLGRAPKLGLRLRLASVTGGQWQNSGGLRAKFGFTAQRFLRAVEYLEQQGQVDALQMIHFHPGSQISNLDHIRQAVNEALQFVLALSQRGFSIPWLNAGGGLGLDYQGNANTDYYSANYTFEDYAAALIEAVHGFCLQHRLEQPALLTESGRALTAHHALLVADVLDVEKSAVPQEEQPSSDNASGAFHDLLAASEHVTTILDLANQRYEAAVTAFAQGEVSLADRAAMEKAYLSFLSQLGQVIAIDCDAMVHQHIAQLTTDKYFLNFSVFRSIPDSWAIGQLFPIVPLTQLDQPLDRTVVLEDITCDSDGRVDRYISPDGPQDFIKLHDCTDGERYQMGVFMVGAYQEILGDNHNLLGLPDRVRIDFGQGELSMRLEKKAQSVAQVLEDVGHYRSQMFDNLKQKLSEMKSKEAVSESSESDLLTLFECCINQSSYPKSK